MLSSTSRSLKLGNSLREKVRSLLDLSLNLSGTEELSDFDITIVCDMLDLTVSLDTFDYNINTIGVLDTKQNFEMLNNFSVWGPRSALSHLLSSKTYMRSAAERLQTNVLNVLVVLTSSQRIDLEPVRRILQMQREKIEVPRSRYLTQLLTYTKTELPVDFLYSLVLLLYVQEPAGKVRLLFDIYDKNGDGFLSRSEILEILGTSISKTGLRVDDTLIEDLCQTLGRISRLLNNGLKNIL